MRTVGVERQHSLCHRPSRLADIHTCTSKKHCSREHTRDTDVLCDRQLHWALCTCLKQNRVVHHLTKLSSSRYCSPFVSCATSVKVRMNNTVLADAHTSAVLAGRAFGELRNLKNLTLDNNEIEVLSPNTFQGLGKLERLYLDGNTESVHGQL